MLVQGRVRVNGRVVTTLGTRVDPAHDRVELDGRPVEPEPFRWVVYHKPPGTLTTADDPQGRPTVYDALPPELGSLGYVGRLDQGTEGLLLLSNDGDVVHRLLHPSGEVEREYRVEVGRAPDRDTLERLVRGVELDDGPARARRAWLEAVGPPGMVGLVLVEGRKREVRRLFEAVGFPVRRLVRVRFGPIVLGDLPAGAWRDLSDEEIAQLRSRAARGPDGESSTWS